MPRGIKSNSVSVQEPEQFPFPGDSISDAISVVDSQIESLKVLIDHLLDVRARLYSVGDLEFLVEYSDRVSFTRGFKLTLKL